MTTPSEQAMKMAREIVAAFGDGLPPFDCGHGACNNCDESLGQLEYAITEAIVTALRAQEVPEGCIRDDKQVDRKVLETAEFIDGVTWGLKRGQSMMILAAAESARTHKETGNG